MLKHLLSRKQNDVAPALAPEGECAYVIGDVHGCIDPLKRLLTRIEDRTTDAHPSIKTRLVFLGDLIDRGPESAEIIERLRNYTPTHMDVTYLMGNHEEVFLDVLKGNVSGMVRWFDWGGRDTARSYGVDNLGLLPIAPEQVLARLQEVVPKSHVEFISGFDQYYEFGDYVFVHAGLRPKVPLEEQTEKDLRWIREKFLSYSGSFPKKVVHGHTIVEDAQNLPNRIAIDTGVYTEGGSLTAAFIHHDTVEFLSEPTKI